jgi:hypothetical protein
VDPVNQRKPPATANLESTLLHNYQQSTNYCVEIYVEGISANWQHLMETTAASHGNDRSINRSISSSQSLNN